MNKQTSAVLIAHGFTGSPHELRALAAYLEERGAVVVLPTLPGHDSSPDELLTNGPNTWLNALREEYVRLKQTHNEVGILGLSVGGSLAIQVAADVSPSFLVTIGAPVRLSYQQAMRIALKIYRLITPDLVKPEKGFFANEEIPGFTQRCYERVPIAAFQEMMGFLEQNMNPSTFEQIVAPTLIVQGSHDPIVASWSAQKLIDGIRSPKKELVRWDDPFHLIVQGERKQELYQRIADWIDEL